MPLSTDTDMYNFKVFPARWDTRLHCSTVRLILIIHGSLMLKFN